MQLLRRLRRSDSNSMPNVRPAACVPDHCGYQRNRLNEGVNNVTDRDVKHEPKRWHYAVEVDLPPVDLTETTKRPGLSQE